MKILLACSAGMSTSLLEKSMNDYIKKNSLDFTVDAKDSASAKDLVKDYDVVLLGPQVKFMQREFERIAENKPVAVIPMQMYGLVKGDEVVKMAQKLLGE